MGHTCLMKDITLLELVDLDHSPHNIVTKIASVSRANINEALEINNMKTQTDEDYKTPISKNQSRGIEDPGLKDLISSLKESTTLLKKMQEKIEKLESKMEFLKMDS